MLLFIISPVLVYANFSWSVASVWRASTWKKTRIFYSTTVIGKWFQNTAVKLKCERFTCGIRPGTTDWKETLRIYLIRFVSRVDFVTWVAKNSASRKNVNRKFFSFHNFSCEAFQYCFLRVLCLVWCLMDTILSLIPIPERCLDAKTDENFETFWKQLVFPLKCLLNVTERK